MSQPENGTQVIEVSETGEGRIYVGLAWDDIYDGKSKVSAGKMAMIRLHDFPVLRTFVALIVFDIFILVSVMQLGLIKDLSNALFILAATTVLFVSLAFYYWKRYWQFSGFGTKEHDKSGRDKDFRHFDIDLHCLVYDAEKKLIAHIGPEKMINANRSVYHSGEDASGGGVYDDETIHVELNNIPDKYETMLFYVANDCAHDFDKVSNLRARLVLSAKEKNLQETLINSNEADGYIFGKIQKNGNEWVWEHTHKYLAFDHDWKAKAADYL